MANGTWDHCKNYISKNPLIVYFQKTIEGNPSPFGTVVHFRCPKQPKPILHLKKL